MAINTNPLFTGTPDVQSVTLTASNSRSDGGGTIATDMFKAYQADATYGSFVSSIKFSLIGTSTTQGVSSAQTILRIYISSAASGVTTSANAWLIQEMNAAVQSANANSPTGAYVIEVGLNKALPAGYTILVSSANANNANTAWQVVVFAGKYTAQV